MAISFKGWSEQQRHFVCHKCGIDELKPSRSQATKAKLKHAREVHGVEVTKKGRPVKATGKLGKAPKASFGPKEEGL
jgi:hypothetical protein